MKLEQFLQNMENAVQAFAVPGAVLGHPKLASIQASEKIRKLTQRVSPPIAVPCGPHGSLLVACSVLISISVRFSAYCFALFPQAFMYPRAVSALDCMLRIVVNSKSAPAFDAHRTAELLGQRLLHWRSAILSRVA